MKGHAHRLLLGALFVSGLVYADLASDVSWELHNQLVKELVEYQRNYPVGQLKNYTKIEHFKMFEDHVAEQGKAYGLNDPTVVKELAKNLFYVSGTFTTRESMVYDRRTGRYVKVPGQSKWRVPTYDPSTAAAAFEFLYRHLEKDFDNKELIEALVPLARAAGMGKLNSPVNFLMNYEYAKSKEGLSKDSTEAWVFASGRYLDPDSMENLQRYAFDLKADAIHASINRRFPTMSWEERSVKVQAQLSREQYDKKLSELMAEKKKMPLMTGEEEVRKWLSANGVKAGIPEMRIFLEADEKDRPEILLAFREALRFSQEPEGLGYEQFAAYHFAKNRAVKPSPLDQLIDYERAVGYARDEQAGLGLAPGFATKWIDGLELTGRLTQKLEQHQEALIREVRKLESQSDYPKAVSLADQAVGLRADYTATIGNSAGMKRWQANLPPKKPVPKEEEPVINAKEQPATVAKSGDLKDDSEPHSDMGKLLAAGVAGASIYSLARHFNLKSKVANGCVALAERLRLKAREPEQIELVPDRPRPDAAVSPFPSARVGEVTPTTPAQTPFDLEAFEKSLESALKDFKL